MGTLAESRITTEARSLAQTRRGLALPAAMFTLVAMAVLISGMYTFTDLGARSVRNRESAARAAHVAEAGVAHTLGLLRGDLRMRSFTQILRGNDNIVGTADDSLFIDWPGVSPGDQIPLAGQAYLGHTYFVTVRDDAADTDANAAADMNGRVLVRCRAVTTDGATAEVEAIIGSVPMPAVAADGNLAVGGNITIGGACGGVHANGDLSSSGGGADIATQATATGTVSGPWNLIGGGTAPKLGGQPEVIIPDLNPMDFCGGAEYRLLSNGTATNGAGGVIGVPIGWNYNAGQLTWNASNTNVPGTYCVEGNVRISGSAGSPAAPLSMSVLATGSINIDGSPVIIPDHPDGILLMAGGDVRIAGQPTAGETRYTGMVYAGAQCLAEGSANLFGQLFCANGAQPAGATPYTDAHSMAGNFSLTFDCSGNVFNKRRILYWYPRIGV